MVKLASNSRTLKWYESVDVAVISCALVDQRWSGNFYVDEERKEEMLNCDITARLC